MIKTVCDICGKDMPPTIIEKIPYITMRDGEVVDTEDYNFIISSPGKVWDICKECKSDLVKWMKKSIEERGEII